MSGLYRPLRGFAREKAGTGNIILLSSTRHV